MEYVRGLDPLILRAAVPATIGAVVAYRLLTARWEGEWTGGDVTPSPLKKSVLRLSQVEQDALPYPPNALPGARDVESPYGSIRVYEWGNEKGPKVLLIHGISTPCISLATVADKLVQGGCRVMLFDLFGRGYSDTPDPATHPQNIQLFTTQILLALASSPLSWTGDSNTFRLVGYSLGGGIATTFTSHFPQLVDSLVLIAPAGLLRPNRIAFTSRLTYSGVLPVRLVHYLVRRRMSGGRLPIGRGGNPEATSGPVATTDAKATVTQAVTSEVPGGDRRDPQYAPDTEAEVRIGGATISVAKAVQWQLKNHDGFLPAFISSIQHAPITLQQPSWRKIGDRLAAQRSQHSGSKDAVLPGTGLGLRGGKILMVLGRDDGVIIGGEVEADAKECVGEEGLVVKYVEAGHDLPVVKADEVASAILAFWKD